MDMIEAIWKPGIPPEFEKALRIEHDKYNHLFPSHYRTVTYEYDHSDSENFIKVSLSPKYRNIYIWVCPNFLARDAENRSKGFTHEIGHVVHGEIESVFDRMTDYIETHNKELAADFRKQVRNAFEVFAEDFATVAHKIGVYPNAGLE